MNISQSAATETVAACRGHSSRVAKEVTVLQFNGRQNSTTVEFWKTGNQWADAAAKTMMQFGAAAIRAGAAFHLAKLACGHGTWESAIGANTRLAYSTVNRYMKLTTNALARINFVPDARAFLAVVAEANGEPLDDFGRGLIKTLDDRLQGKSQRQLEIEFGIRKARLAADEAAELAQAALRWATRMVKGLNECPLWKGHLPDESHDELCEAISRALKELEAVPNPAESKTGAIQFREEPS